MWIVSCSAINTIHPREGRVPPVCTPESALRMVWGIGARPTSDVVPFPLRLQLRWDGMAWGEPVTLARTTVAVSLPCPASPGMHVVDAILLEVPHARWLSIAVQVCVEGDPFPSVVPVLPDPPGGYYLPQYGTMWEWVDIAALCPQTLPAHAPLGAPFTDFLPGSGRYVDHIMPLYAYLNGWQYRVVQDSVGHQFVVPLNGKYGDHFRLNAAAEIDKAPVCDGVRGVGWATSYVSGVVCPGSGMLIFVEKGLRRGRVGQLTLDGTMTTIVGYRSRAGVVPYNPYDAAIPEDVRAQQYEAVGTWDVPLALPTDVCVDVDDMRIWYVADSQNHRIARVDARTKTLTTYAGVPAQPGYHDGMRAEAHFNEPTSVTMAPDRSLYVADRHNHCIRRISAAGQVTTVVGHPQAMPDEKRLGGTVLTRRAQYLVNAPGISASLCYPTCVRWAHHGHLYFGEPYLGSIRHWNPQTDHVSTIHLAPIGVSWQWFDLAADGQTGPDDALVFVSATGSGGVHAVAMRRDGTDAHRLLGGRGAFPNYAHRHWVPHYPWLVACGRGGIWLAGFGTMGIVRIRTAMSTDPVPPTAAEQRVLDAALRLWTNGSAAESPHPSFALLHGHYGQGGLLASMVALLGMSDAELHQVLRSGWGGTPRALTDTEVATLDTLIRWRAVR